MTISEYQEIIAWLLEHVGLASCSGNKCRLPHCTDCNYGEEIDWDAHGAMLERARGALKQ